MNHGRSVWPAVVAFLLPLAVARADDPPALPDHATLSLEWQPTADAPPAPPRPRAFGAEGSQWWTASVGAAYDFEESTDFNVRVAYSYFLINDVEFSLELNGWYFNQPGDNAFGVNPAMTFRWHFIDKEPWTVYADIGIGVLAATSDVPAGGTSFDFTPKAGVGFTHRLGDSDNRLQVGVRWHHVSNARIFGSESNPARDGVMVYAGIQWPF